MMVKQAADLYALAGAVLTAQRHVESARNVVAKDKQERAGSLVARLVDVFATTPPEAVLNDAEARLVAVLEKGRAAARTWIVETASQGLAEQPADAERHQGQGQRLERAQARARQVRRWLELAQLADNRLCAARSACESASMTELMDVVSTSTVISALSCMDTSSAAEAIKSAGVAVQALADALPKRVEQASIDRPDDVLDFVADLVFDPGFDVFSLFNMQRLDDAAEQCKQAGGKLRPLLDRLTKLAADAQAKAEQERAALRGIEAPYLEAAASQVPDALRVPAPNGFSS